MSRIFGVTTDYLVKDELGEPEYAADDSGTNALRKVSLEEAQSFLAAKAANAKPAAWATFLCILSPVCLLLLAAASDTGRLPISNSAAAGIGLCVLLALVAAATAVFIACGARTKRFAYLESEVFETEYGVIGMVRERQKKYQKTYARYNMIGTVLCILSVVPLFIGSAISDDNFILVLMLSLLLLFVGIGVVLFILAGIYWESLQKLLQEGEYTAKQKKNAVRKVVDEIYWPIVTAIFLAYSFITGNWGGSWIIWPVAGVLYAAIMAVCGVVGKKKEQ